MKLGFSTLALFIKSLEDMEKIAKENNFEMIELLSEGPYAPGYLLENSHLLEPLKNTSLEICIHAPNVDLNVASINRGIKEESKRQLFETIDLAAEISATAITLHPGHIGRIEKRIKDMATEIAIESVGELVDYGKEKNVIVSVENMPNRAKFLGTTPEDIERISKGSGSNITIDTGHANTTEYCSEFFDLKNISYFHLNDNDGIKDQHVSLGEGTLDLELLKKVNKGILELNTFEKVLKSQKVISNI